MAINFSARAMRGRRLQLGTGSTNPDRMVPVETVVRYLNSVLNAGGWPELRLSNIPDAPTLDNIMRLVCQAIGAEEEQEGKSPNPQSIPDLQVEQVQPPGFNQFALVKTSQVLSKLPADKRELIKRRVLSQMMNQDRTRRATRQLSKSGLTHAQARNAGLRLIGRAPSKDSK